MKWRRLARDLSVNRCRPCSIVPEGLDLAVRLRTSTNGRPRNAMGLDRMESCERYDTALALMTQHSHDIVRPATLPDTALSAKVSALRSEIFAGYLRSA